MDLCIWKKYLNFNKSGEFIAVFVAQTNSMYGRLLDITIFEINVLVGIEIESFISLRADQVAAKRKSATPFAPKWHHQY